MLGYIAKAITGGVLTALLYVIGDPDVVNSLGDEVETIVVSVLVGLGVFAVPNQGAPAPRG